MSIENAYLRHQVLVRRRKVKRPTLTTFDRMMLTARHDPALAPR